MLTQFARTELLLGSDAVEKLKTQRVAVFGIGGVVTFQNAKKLREAVEYIPIEQILLETDSPYLAPVPNRGKRNSSLNIPYIAEAIAQIKGISCEEVTAVTERNAKKLFFGEA